MCQIKFSCRLILSFWPDRQANSIFLKAEMEIKN
jgi:hypothetical protein